MVVGGVVVTDPNPSASSAASVGGDLRVVVAAAKYHIFRRSETTATIHDVGRGRAGGAGSGRSGGSNSSDGSGSGGRGDRNSVLVWSGHEVR